jgi:phosphate transport system substrate-binding protein
MANHPGTKITVQGGGSDAGISAINLGIIDIGAASKAVPADDKYKTLQTYQIGGSAVVVITNAGNPIHNVTAGALADAYALADKDGKVAFTTDATGNVTGVAAGTTTTLYQRSEGSGTEETFAEWVGKSITTPVIDFKTPKSMDASKAVGAAGNAGVLAAVKGSGNGLGFVDYGFATTADKASGVQIVGVSSAAVVAIPASVTDWAADGSSTSGLKTQMLNSLKGTAKFPMDTTATGKELTRPLNLITNGDPSSVVKNFINFARSPESKATINTVGGFSITEFA